MVIGLLKGGGILATNVVLRLNSDDLNGDEERIHTPKKTWWWAVGHEASACPLTCVSRESRRLQYLQPRYIPGPVHRAPLRLWIGVELSQIYQCSKERPVQTTADYNHTSNEYQYRPHAIYLPGDSEGQ